MLSKFSFSRFILSIALLSFSSLSFAFKPQEVGLVMMQGKWGRPPGPIAKKLEGEGYQVVSPEMPWSRNRNYDATYEQNIEDIHQLVQQLRLEGSKLVILGGLSFGANAVLAYLSKYQDIDGVMIFSPGHLPERFYVRGLTSASVDHARALLQSGQANMGFSFTDYNQGRNREMSSTVSIYLSYFDPNSLANMPKSASLLSKSIPVFCVMSSAEQSLGKDYFFSKLPNHPLSKYIESTSTHMGAPEATFNEALSFIQSVSNS
jgi:pimeloyl-ACP methyl ester carboxylesterase